MDTLIEISCALLPPVLVATVIVRLLRLADPKGTDDALKGVDVGEDW